MIPWGPQDGGDRKSTRLGDWRTSLIVDPPDGKAKYRVGPFDSWEDADTRRGLPRGWLPLVALQGYSVPQGR